MELIMHHRTYNKQALSCNMRTKLPKHPDIVACMEKKHTQATLIENLEMLMRVTGMKPPRLAKESGVSIRMIYFILNGEKVPSINLAEKLASAFKLKAWHLVLPSLPLDIKRSGDLERLINLYLDASGDGSEYIIQVAEKQAENARLKASINELKTEVNQLKTTKKPALPEPEPDPETAQTIINVHKFRNKRVQQVKFKGKDRRKQGEEDNG